MAKDIKKIYNHILMDDEIIKVYGQVEEYETSTGGYAFHNFEHIKSVTSIVDKVLKELGFDESFIYKAKIACLLHDVGAVQGKDNHALRSYEYAKKYFNVNNISFDGMDLVLEAIKIHSDGFETDNIIALSIILADKLDVKKSRISAAGKKLLVIDNMLI